MKKFTISLFLALSIGVPWVSSAQASGCVALVNNLHYRSRNTYTNGEVSVLQGLMHEQNYLSVAPTGYFGLLTLQAVKDFQSANGIISTGYVGPITRAKIKSLTCGTNLSLTITTSSPLPSVRVGQYYQTPLNATGGYNPADYSWTLSSGTFPPGLSLHPLPLGCFGCAVPEVISGTPTRAGVYIFTIGLTSNPPPGSEAPTLITNKQFSLTVNPQ